jgi:hypothetical protein
MDWYIQGVSGNGVEKKSSVCDRKIIAHEYANIPFLQQFLIKIKIFSITMKFKFPFCSKIILLNPHGKDFLRKNVCVLM